MPFLSGLSGPRRQARLESLDLRSMSQPQAGYGLQEAQVHHTLLPVAFRNLPTI